ncbi:MAG: sensor histidine kinase [Bacteroidetes bacterium]|nr:sensor histidine kinase [Bacteroidota bacterium]
MIKKSIAYIFIFIVFSATAQYSSEIKLLLKKVKDASYYDSIHLFKVGEETINKALKTSFDKAAVADVYIHYGNYFYYTQNVARAKNYFTLALEKAKQTNNSYIKHLALIRILYLDYEQGLGLDIEQNFNLLLNECQKNKDYKNVCEILNLLGIIKESKNQKVEAANLYLKGIAISESQNIERYPAVFRNNLGLLKFYANQINDALVDYEKAYQIAKKENDKNLLSHLQINICLVYVAQNKISEALSLFKNVINYTRANNRPRELSVAFIDLASSLNKHNKKEIALSYADSAIFILKGSSLINELSGAYIGKSEILIDLKLYSQARQTLKDAEAVFIKTNRLEDRIIFYYLNYKIAKEERNYKDAFNYILMHQTYKDSLEHIMNGKIIQELQLKHNVQKKEIELEKEKSKYLLLEKKHQEERFLKWLTIGIALLVLIVLGGIVYYLYLRKVQEKQIYFSRQLIQTIENDRSRISMDLHDDIGQSLSMIKAKISILNADTTHKKIEEELSRVIDQTRNISKNLYPSYLEKIGLIRSIARLLENIQSSTNIECSFDISEKVELLPITTKTHLYRIIQECSNNTIKHAQASALKITITQRQHEFILTYQDNGIGLSNKQKSGLGLLSIAERSKIINGNISIDTKTNKGFKLTLRYSA